MKPDRNVVCDLFTNRPLDFHARRNGADKQHRSRDATRARGLHTARTVARMKRSEIRERRRSVNAAPGLRCASSGLRRQRKKEAERRQTCASTSAPRRQVYAVCANHLWARRAPSGALAWRRSTTALTVGAFAPRAQLQAMLPGTWQDARSCKPAPYVLIRALSAPACPSPGNAPPGPVVVPVR